MDNDETLMEEIQEIADDLSESEAAFDSPAANSIRLGWRVIVLVIALVVVAILAYPFLQERLNADVSDEASPAPVAQNALSVPEATAQANPTSAEAQFELGNSYVQAGQLEQAQAAYQKAIELDPDYQAAYANLGVVYYHLQRLDLAALQYQKALEINPQDGEVAYNLGALYLQQALSGGDQPDRDLLEQAVVQIKQAMELSPDLAEPYFSLGVAYSALNQPEDAIQAFETFVERDTGQDPRASQEAQRYLQSLRGQ